MSGDVPRNGAYDMRGRCVTVLRALIAAGADPPAMEGKFVSVRRANHVVFRSKVTDLVTSGDDELLRAGDGVSVTDTPP